MGWGFYSPGIACPQGYTTAAMATAGGSTGWGLEYSLTDGETAAACCPTGFTPSSIETFNTYAATCVNLATSTSFSTVVCNSGSFEDFSLLELPNDDMKTFTVYAPLYQLNFQASDLPQTTESESEPTSSEDGASPSSTGLAIPLETGSSTTTSDPVASLIPSSLRSSVTSSATSTAAAASSTPGSGMSTGAKVGIGVGVGVGVVILLVAAFFFGRARRKDKNPVTEDGKSTAALSIPKLEGPDRKNSLRAELGGAEISELEGKNTQELPATALSVGRLREPAAIFELEADNPNTLAPPTPRYGQGDTLVSPVTPTRQGAHSPSFAERRNWF
ncbi:hypothetical protein PFICI_08440 [Pestalotiopsis fici W106-1]|uniref:Uncharacterized protein n=1 Tax=Pestalotiopsis fici (strain W106-1 / CGMCC3.15140) TaxID=1229662 RepID=W3X6V0_PESFW|nr:uncharacterized protein PFICI_08440 [Pestalotiopsis fici W106-1]ETS80911.1 hypothetical protein PFICI_08440 [Pestalotiopsis fici W106-1]